MKTKIISKILLTLGLALVLGGAITHVNGGTQRSSASLIGPPDQFPVVNINTVNVSGIRMHPDSVGALRMLPEGKSAYLS